MGNSDHVMKNATGSGATDTPIRYTMANGPVSRGAIGDGGCTGIQMRKPAVIHAMSRTNDPSWDVISGSTMIGAEQCGRNSFLMELDTLYCDVIVDRYQRFSGNKAILERTGESPIPMQPREQNMR